MALDQTAAMNARRFPPPWSVEEQETCFASRILLRCGDDSDFQRLLSCVRAGLRVVLNNLSEQVSECLQHAMDCALQAAVQTDPKIIGSLELFGVLAFMVMLYFLLPIYDHGHKRRPDVLGAEIAATLPPPDVSA